MTDQTDNSRRAQKAPRPPEELVDALHDRTHETSGRLLHASPVLPPKQNDYAPWNSDEFLTSPEAVRAYVLETAGTIRALDERNVSCHERDRLAGEVERLKGLYNARMLDLHAAQDRETELQAEAVRLKNQVLLQIRWKSEAQDELEDICNELPGVAFMDPPDGGSVSIAEQVRRMYAALRERDAEVAALREDIDGHENYLRSIAKTHPDLVPSIEHFIGTDAARRAGEGEKS